MTSLTSSGKKIGRPILANLLPYYVPFLSHHAQPTYPPKNGTSLMDVPLQNFFENILISVEILWKIRITDPIFFPFCLTFFFLEALLQLFTIFFCLSRPHFFFLGLRLECKSALELVSHDRNLNHQLQRDNFKVLGYSILLRGRIIFQF